MNKARLKSQLRAHAMTQAEAAQRLGISPASFSAKVNGHREFTLKELRALRAALGMTSRQVDRIFFE